MMGVNKIANSDVKWCKLYPLSYSLVRECTSVFLFNPTVKVSSRKIWHYKVNLKPNFSGAKQPLPQDTND